MSAATPEEHYFPLCFKISASPTRGLTYSLSPWMTLGPCMMVTESCLERGVRLPYCHLLQSGAPGCLRHLHLAGRYDKGLRGGRHLSWVTATGQAHTTWKWSRLPLLRWLNPASISLSGHPGHTAECFSQTSISSGQERSMFHMEMSESKSLNLQLNPTQWSSQPFCWCIGGLRKPQPKVREFYSVKFKDIDSHNINKIHDMKFFMISIKKLILMHYAT